MASTTEAILLPKIHLVESDGMPMDTAWHRDAMLFLIEQVRYHLRHRQDYFVGGNMFIYFSLKQAHNRDFRGPDFFYVNGVDWNPLRPYWVVWEEDGRYPDVVIELLSATTAVEDLTTKKDIYQNTFRTPEYFTYDPETQHLQGWRLVGRVYEPIQPNEKGWLWCDELQLWLAIWEGTYQNNEWTWLRFYDPAGNLVPVFAEAEQQRADAEQQRADAEQQRADAEQQRADAEQQRADAEQQRADALQAELARLKQGE